MRLDDEGIAPTLLEMIDDRNAKAAAEVKAERTDQDEDARNEAFYEQQDAMMSDQIGRCKRPSQPPGIRKP